MSTALFTGLSGLRSFETYLDVIGNNISNANTTGFRGSRVTFGDLLSLTISPGSAPTSTVGGRNPAQIGLGVGVRSIDQNTNTGSLMATDRNLDLTIFGPGFFVVNDGMRDYYTRAGTFGFDAQGQLVEIGTGYLVQTRDGQGITVPPGDTSPPQATANISLKGNLPATVTGPLEEILTTSNPYLTGTAAQITSSNAGPFALNDGDALTVQVDGGPPQTVTFHTADFVNIAAATAAEVAAVINASATGVTADGSSGSLVLTSDTIGSSSQLKISDVNSNPAFVMGLSTVLVQGTQSPAGAGVNLNDLVTNITDYVNGDGVEVQGSLADGTQFAATFVYGTDGTTVGDLVSFIDALMTDADVALDAQGNITVTAQTAGDAAYALSLEDSPGNTGATDFSHTSFSVTREGTDPDTVNTAITIYDANGEAHVLSMTLERVQGSEWQLLASLPDGTLLSDNLVSNITFNSDGTLSSAGTLGVGNTDIEITFPSTGSQVISLDFGSTSGGGITGITQFGGPGTAQATSQDGYAFGTLADIVVTENGLVNGVFTNGQSQTYGQIALATFSNPGGLKREGNNMFSETVNTGVPQLDYAGGAGGTLQSGVLESSNVDLAEEFVHMIEAQRGYQASARVIRASEELLASLLQNI